MANDLAAPVFDRIVGHDMSERALLGHPPWVTAFQTAVHDATQSLWRQQEELGVLLERLQDPALPCPHRLAAGEVLALLGDPRLQVFKPEMCEVPAAAVDIGLPAEELAAVADALRPLGVAREWIAKEVPRHRVMLAAYRIARFPVTNLEYRAFLDDAGSEARLPRAWPLGVFPYEKANHPVHGIRPDDADAYAHWLSARTGRRFRLPTEAEWEYAASGPQGLEFPWQGDFSADLANTAELGWLRSSPVGAFPGGASWCGAQDMAGNVEEIVGDGYKPYPGASLVQDDLYKADPGHRIARGGSFCRFRDLARCRRRHGFIQASAVYVMGFRLVEEP